MRNLLCDSPIEIMDIFTIAMSGFVATLAIVAIVKCVQSCLTDRVTVGQVRGRRQDRNMINTRATIIIVAPAPTQTPHVALEIDEQNQKAGQKKHIVDLAIDEQTNELTNGYTCPICLDPSVSDDNTIDLVMIDSCKHMFCKSCITQWLTNKSTCPLCSLNLV